MLAIACLSCGNTIYAECAGVAQQAGRQPCGRDDCPHLDPDAAYDRAGGCGCCKIDHHHGRAAGSCPGGHGPCPYPDRCLLWLSQQPHLEGSNARDTSAGPCPGGHCGLNVPGCKVCRPLRVTTLPGSITLRPVGWGG